MTRIKLGYIQEFRDQHGRLRRYFRRPGYKRVPLPGAPGSEEFMAAYQAAMVGQALRPEIGASRTKPGTVNAAVVGYFNSMAFRSLSASTQATYRGILKGFRAEHGDKRVAMLERRHVDRIIAGEANTPAAANNLLRMLKTLMQWTVAEGMRRDDPTIGLKGIKTRSDGFLIWGEDLIAAHRRCHALGTRARLALELLVNTGQRRGDIVRMGRQHVRDGTLSIRQEKTGTLVEIPILPELQAAIEAMPASDHLTFLTTEFGKPFTAAGFGNWFRETCDEAGIPKGYAAHGLRKAAATRHADSGATAHELMAWFGWKTLKEAERYTRSANRKRLAQGVVEKLTRGTSSVKPE
jgi:integrase